MTNTGEGWVGCLLRWGSSTAPGMFIITGPEVVMILLCASVCGWSIGQTYAPLSTNARPCLTLHRVEYRSNLCSTLHETWIITLILLSYNHVSPGSLTRGQGSRPPGLGTADAHRRHSTCNISLTINNQIHDSQSSSHHSNQTLQR